MILAEILKDSNDFQHCQNFFATMQEPNKDNSREKIFVRKKDFPKNSPSSLKGCSQSGVVDFYVKSLSLVIEIDGSSHNDKDEYDADRQKFLESFGLKVYRIDARDIKQNLDAVMKDLEAYVMREFSPADTNISTPRPTDTPLEEGNFGQKKPEKSKVKKYVDENKNCNVLFSIKCGIKEFGNRDLKNKIREMI
jgi:hypothetical protein